MLTLFSYYMSLMLCISMLSWWMNKLKFILMYLSYPPWTESHCSYTSRLFFMFFWEYYISFMFLGMSYLK